LLEVIGGLQNPSEGVLKIDNKTYQGAHEDVGMVFQEESTFPWLTVKDNVEFGMKMARVPEKRRENKALDMIRLVGLKGYEENYPGQLSGGMKQRVAIARSLVLDPEILLMDEPFGSLDMQTRVILGEELLNIWREINNTILFVTHDIDEAVRLGDRVVLMTHDGGVRDVREIEIDRPRESNIKSNKEYSQQVDALWGMLKEETEEVLKGV